jgi:restriction system protein
MFPLLLALVVFAIAGVGATAWLRRQPPTEHDLAKGLSGLRWGDFTRLVLRAMHARGYATIGDDGKPTDGVTADGKDILLKRGAQLTLLSCKYGSGSIVSAQAVLGLGKSAQLRGADATIVVTPGRFESEARRVASLQQVELIDGEQLWPKVKPFIPEQLLPGNSGKLVNPNAPRMAWIGAAALGAIAWPTTCRHPSSQTRVRRYRSHNALAKLPQHPLQRRRRCWIRFLRILLPLRSVDAKSLAVSQPCLAWGVPAGRHSPPYW